MDLEDQIEQAFESQCFLMQAWTVHDLIRKVPDDLEERLTEVLNDIAARHAGLTEKPEFA